MNPLKFRLPAKTQSDPSVLKPQPSALNAWLNAQPTINIQTTAPLLLSLLQQYNRCTMPAAVRLKSLIALQPTVEKLLQQLLKGYQHEPQPLPKSAQIQANMALKFLDEVAIGYKTIVTDCVTEKAGSEMGVNLFIASVQMAIDHLGRLSLECYAQYTQPPKGIWGELHRLYSIAENTGLHKLSLAKKTGEQQSLATVQHVYLRLVLLALTQPNHLLPGEARLLYKHLENWTPKVRMIQKKNTIAEAGDIVIDLDGERPPAIATGYARFRPVVGRFLDIKEMLLQLDDALPGTDEPKSQQGLVSFADRQQHNLITRVRKAWQGRAERKTERTTGEDRHIQLCIGLESAHHFVSDEHDFTPEQDEHLFLQNKLQHKTSSDSLELAPTGGNSWALNSTTNPASTGHHDTRVSHFGEKIDVWDTIHQTETHARIKREETMAYIQAEAWLCLNQSLGGVSLRRLPESLLRARVGAIVAFRDADGSILNTAEGSTPDTNVPWKIGALRWIQNSPKQGFDVGVMTLGSTGSAVAVRAISGTGTGGEYFRSLLVAPGLGEKNDISHLLAPANIFDVDTQLVLNLQTTIKYVRLTRMVETSSSYTQFEFREIEPPPAELAKIGTLGVCWIKN